MLDPIILADAQRNSLRDGLLAKACTDCMDQALIHFITINSLQDLTRCLVFGANPNSTDQNGLTASMLAIVNGAEVAMLELLANRGADLNARDKDGMTAVMWAIGSARTDLLAFLADKGVDLDARDEHGMSAAIRASCFGYRHALRVLADKGANLYLADNLGRTAADHAASNADRRTLAVINDALRPRGRRVNVAVATRGRSTSTQLVSNTVVAVARDLGSRLEGMLETARNRGKWTGSAQA